MHRDITTDKGINSQNILAHLGNEVRGYAKSNHFKNSDFQEIIHIVDRDGAYVLENCIIVDGKACPAKEQGRLFDLTYLESCFHRNPKKWTLACIPPAGFHPLWESARHRFCMVPNLKG